ncbi:hypothetical protein GH714_019768 [Hevea brasiliensis]|uniref:CCHC-type domain-containing protein n=1 Tax=Hevea brasiliensis TaxID=3981 RepID=A0A6A6LJ86_HEVBR|nr:hypothetical protein GH714_019768 [Hevea brasiliensis]
MESLNEPLITQWAIMKIENPFLVFHQFINGLRLDIQKELKLHYPETIEEAYHKALEINSYNQFPTSGRFASQLVRSHQSKSSLQSVGPSQFKTVSKSSFNSKDSTGKSIGKINVSVNSHFVVASSGSQANSSSINCFHCHDKGHIASRCLHRALALEQACDDEHESEHNSSDYEEEVVGPIDYSGEEDELDIDDELDI